MLSICLYVLRLSVACLLTRLRSGHIGHRTGYGGRFGCRAAATKGVTDVSSTVKNSPPCEICVCCGSLLMAPMNVRHLFESATWILSLLSSLVYFVIIVTLFITVCYPSLLPSSVEVHVLAVSCPCCEIVLWQLVYQSTLVEQSTTSQVSTASRTQPRLSILSQRCIVISHARLASRLWCVYDVPKVNSLYWFKSFYAVW